jgi:hypothetical protein
MAVQLGQLLRAPAGFALNTVEVGIGDGESHLHRDDGGSRQGVHRQIPMRCWSMTTNRPGISLRKQSWIAGAR